MKTLIAIIGVLAILTFAVAVSAQVNPPTKENEIQKANPTPEQTEITKEQTQPPNQPAPAAKTAKQKPPTMSGTVVSVDTATSTLVLKGPKGNATFTVDPKAMIMMGKKTIKLAELPKGSKVAVMYATENGKMVAKHVMEQKMPPMKKTAPMPEMKKAMKPETSSTAKPVAP